MNNSSRKRSKPKRDNLSEGGGQGISMILNNVLFWKDNTSWYQEPMLHHYSPNLSRKYSNFNQDYQEEARSERMLFNQLSDVRSEMRLPQNRINPSYKLQNKSEYSVKEIGGSSNKTQIGCKCTKVNCLKRTCGCFDEGRFCGKNCICTGCKNVQDNGSQIQKAKVEAKLRSNRSIFDNVQHVTPTKVCTCPKTKCLKKYCQCYSSGIACNEFCKCLNCQNTEQHRKNMKYQNGSTIQKSSYQKSIGKDI